MIEKGPWGKIKVELSKEQQPTLERALTWLSGQADSLLFERQPEDDIANAIERLKEHAMQKTAELQEILPLPDHLLEDVSANTDALAENVIRAMPELHARIFHNLLQRVREPDADYFMVPATIFLNGLDQAAEAYSNLEEASISSDIRALADSMRREMEELR